MSREDGFRDPGLCDSCHSAPCLCASTKALQEQWAATPDTVHILKHGRSYCGMFGVPGRWPPKHLWVSFEDDWEAAATCGACRIRAGIDLGTLGPLTLADAAAGGAGLATRPKGGNP